MVQAGFVAGFLALGLGVDRGGSQRQPLFVQDSLRLDDADGTIRHRPEDFGSMPELQLLFLVGLLIIRRLGGGPLRFGQ